MKDRRKFPRREVSYTAEILTNKTVYRVPIRNLSQGGIEVIRPQNWETKPEYLLKININDMAKPSTFISRIQICWMTDSSIGLKFHKMEMQKKILLNKILSTISRNEVMEQNCLGI